MTFLKLTDEQQLLLRDLGCVFTSQCNTQFFLPYVFIQHEKESPGVMELVYLGQSFQEVWTEFCRLQDDLAFERTILDNVV